MNAKNTWSENSVSVVLFCYNEAQYIAKAIRSIQSQTVAVDEIIVVDDSSTDGTVNIVKKLANRDKRITCLHNQYEKGKVGAYQTGLEAVTSEFFFVMGADDEACPNLVEFSLTKSEKNTLPFFFHSAEMIDENSSPLSRTFVSDFDPATCFYYNKTGGLIFARHEIINNIIPFPKQLEFEDWYTVLTLFQNYGCVETSKLPLVRYRIHPNSDSQSSRWNWHRRKSLQKRDIRFLKLMQEKSSNDVFKAELVNSIRFRERLLNGLPSLGNELKTSVKLLKSYCSVMLARLVTRLTNVRMRSTK